jgi:hypothetical protein
MTSSKSANSHMVAYKSRKRPINRALLRKRMETERNAQTRAAKQLIGRYLNKQLDNILGELGSNRKSDDDAWARLVAIDITDDKDKAIRSVVDQLNDLIDWGAHEADLQRILRPVWQNAYSAGAAAAKDVYMATNVQQPQLTRHLIERGAQRVSGITDTTRTELAKSIADGVVAGDGRGALIQRVQERMPGVQAGRAGAIAANEVHTSLVSGNFDMIKAAGYKAKTWLTSGDTDVRSTHAPLNKVTIGIDERFSNGLLYPGDPSGPPGETIGCRCDIAAAGPDEIKPPESQPPDEQPVEMASNFFGNNLHGSKFDEALYHNSREVEPEPEYEDVFIHGDSQSFEVRGAHGDYKELTVADLAGILRKSTNYQGGSIRLLACNTGHDPEGAAQQLADLLGVEVKAPNRKLYIYPKNYILIADDPADLQSRGGWVIFKPRR